MADVMAEIRTQHISNAVLKETCVLPELKVQFHLYHDRRRYTDIHQKLGGLYISSLLIGG
jgi:hypothetical protein